MDPGSKLPSVKRTIIVLFTRMFPWIETAAWIHLSFLLAIVTELPAQIDCRNFDALRVSRPGSWPLCLRFIQDHRGRQRRHGVIEIELSHRAAAPLGVRRRIPETKD